MLHYNDTMIIFIFLLLFLFCCVVLSCTIYASSLSNLHLQMHTALLHAYGKEQTGFMVTAGWIFSLWLNWNPSEHYLLKWGSATCFGHRFVMSDIINQTYTSPAMSLSVRNGLRLEWIISCKGNQGRIQKNNNALKCDFITIYPLYWGELTVL